MFSSVSRGEISGGNEVWISDFGSSMAETASAPACCARTGKPGDKLDGGGEVGGVVEKTR